MITELVFWNETAKPSLDPKLSIAQAIASSAPISSTSAEISLGSTTRPPMIGRRFAASVAVGAMFVAPGTSPSSA